MQNVLTLLIISSFLISIQYSTIKFANGDTQNDSNILIYNSNMEDPVLVDSNNTMLKPKVEVSIEGTPNDDKVKGGDGDDEMEGRDGNDQIIGGNGDDKLDGEEGDDLLSGNSGNDEIKGGIGNDGIFGERGNDIVEGGKGDDKISGGQETDLLDGEEGNDAIVGGEGRDILFGGLGSDIFVCDELDKIIDFSLSEEDQIKGTCSVEYMEKKIVSYNDNNKNISSKDFESIPRIAQPPIPLQSFNANDPQKNSEYQSSQSQSPIPPTPSSQSPIPPTPFLPNETSVEDFQFLSTLQSQIS
ncbi:MAG: calcium-binding protein [Nitrososphaeraceae archaeon]